MDQLKAFKFLEQHKDLLLPNKEYTDQDVEDALLAAPDDFELTMRGLTFRNPLTVQIISVLVGSLGVDRFYLGDIAKGVLKYFTFGGFGIWWLVDIFSAKDRCRAYNCKKLMTAVNNPSVVARMQNVDSKIGQAVAVAKKFAPAAKEIAKGIKDVGSTFYIDN